MNILAKITVWIESHYRKIDVNQREIEVLLARSAEEPISLTIKCGFIPDVYPVKVKGKFNGNRFSYCPILSSSVGCSTRRSKVLGSGLSSRFACWRVRDDVSENSEANHNRGRWRKSYS